MEYESKLFAALADPLRLRCLALLARKGELCVCELTAALQSAQPRVSKHLAILKECGLVRDRRDAQWVLYAIPDTQPGWVQTVVSGAMAGLEGDETHAADLARLAKAHRPPRRRQMPAAVTESCRC